MSKIYKNIWMLCTALLLTSCNQEKTNQSNDADQIMVCINKIVDHEALDETARGIKETLEASELNLKIVTESSQGNVVMSSQLTDKFVGQKADVIVGIGTVAAQSFIKYANDNSTYFIFSSVTDPKAAGLTNKPQISGVSNFIELESQVELFLEIQPNLKKIGFLYNNSEINSVMLIEKLKTILEKRGIALVLQTATKTSEVSQAVENLAKKVDAIFISNDNTALSAFKCIVNIATKYSVPVYVSDTDIVHKGAIAALGPNQYKIGVQTAHLILERLRSKVFQDKTEYPKNEDILLIVNQNAAQKCGITFSEHILKRAHKILTESN
jgi:putative ABC transport system substrate-binding protein